MSGRETRERSAKELVGLQLRFKEELRSRLTDAARAQGRSLNSEIVDRLEQSIQQEDRAFGPQTYAVLQRIADELNRMGNVTGKEWFADAETNHASSLAARDIVLDQYVPDKSRLQAAVDLNRKKLPMRERADALIEELEASRVIASPKANSSARVASVPLTELPESRWKSVENWYEPMTDAERAESRIKLSELKNLLIQLDDLHAEEERLFQAQREAARQGEALYAAIRATRQDLSGGA